MSYANNRSVLPAIAFTLDMYRRTGQFFGINEALLSSALAAMVFSVLACQPLTIVGVTGLIALFNYTIYDIITIYDPSIYPAFTAWVGIWAAIFHWIVAFGNFSDYMAYVTDFSSETFGMYVGIIYCSTSRHPVCTHYSHNQQSKASKNYSTSLNPPPSQAATSAS
jgi:hypothetical protein